MVESVGSSILDLELLGEAEIKDLEDAVVIIANVIGFLLGEKLP